MHISLLFKPISIKAGTNDTQKQLQSDATYFGYYLVIKHMWQKITKPNLEIYVCHFTDEGLAYLFSFLLPALTPTTDCESRGKLKRH